MIRKPHLNACVCVLLCAGVLVAQTPVQPTRQDEADVLLIVTELVQTDVMVFDKGGQFVRGLKREDFELKIDGKPKPIDFFETVTAGTASEEAQLAAARRTSRSTADGISAAKPLDRGRSVFFYVDDIHLDLGSLAAGKKVIRHFIDNEMGQNDEAAIASATGQIGFLQQLTDNKTVLRTAVERLKYRPYSVTSLEEPRMTEYQALLIDRYDRDTLGYFIDETLKRNPGITRESAEATVTGRARTTLQQAGTATTNTLIGLEGLVRSGGGQPGRKLIFFVSGGFFLDNRNSTTGDRLRRITSAAARSGVVIYSMDARGLIPSTQDATQSGQIDLTGRLQRSAGGEVFASQDAMNALAVDTGGKPFFNSNALEPGLKRALSETSTYYLLAWKPESESKTGKFRRLEVRVTGRPELSVQVRRGFFDIEPEEPVKQAKKVADKATGTPSELQLRKVIGEAYPNREIPISLSLSYIDDPTKGILLSAAMQVPGEFLSSADVGGKQNVAVNLAGSFYNDHGQVGAVFKKPVTFDVAADAPPDMGRDVLYKYNVYLKPGLYQVRVGARDERTGRTGSAHRWIEIPDLSTGQLALSSLLIGSRSSESVLTPTATTDSVETINQSVDNSFPSNGYLRLLLFVYNSTVSPSDSKPDLAVQVQIVRDEQPTVTAPLRKISTEGLTDLKRIPYAAEISLADLASGSYQLQVSVVDRVSKKSASQQVRFIIR